MEFVTCFVTNYGYLAIFLLLAPGTFGLPIPDELLLTFLGYLVLQGDLQLLPTLAVVVAGLTLGLTLDYWVGRTAGARLVRQAGAFWSIRPDRFARLQARLHRGGGWVICLGNFLPGVRHWVPLAAGVTKFPLAGFTRSAYAGALVWSLGYIFLGYFWGREAGLLVARLGAHGRLAAGVIVILLLGYLLFRVIWLRPKSTETPRLTP